MPQEMLKKEFSSIDEAFEALGESVKQHSKRVSEYAGILFLQACVSEGFTGDTKTRAKLDPVYRDIAEKCGLYHDIGKALVPEQYHNCYLNFSPEEVALYRKHAVDGSDMLETLLADVKGDELIIIQDAVEGHHERWDGNGFPKGLLEQENKIFGRIVGVADALDHFAMEKRLEFPFEYAIDQILAGSGTLYDPQLVNLVREVRLKLKKIFISNIGVSNAIPVTDTFISRRATRPMQLFYRPIVAGRRRKAFAFEAEMRFKDGRDGYVVYDDVKHIISRNRLLGDMSVYFVLELCDTIRRLDTCEISVEYIALNLPLGSLKRKGYAKSVLQVLSDTRVANERLCYVITMEMWQDMGKIMPENIAELSKAGVRFMLTGVNPVTQRAEPLKKMGISIVRIVPEQLNLDLPKTTAKIKELVNGGLTVIADGMMPAKHITLLNSLGVSTLTGALAGDYMPEDIVVETELSILGA